MSTTVDQRVVEMKFDNRQFESGVRESMSTLDKLKQALNFNKTATGLDNISKEVSKIDMSSLAESTQVVANRFSALDVIAVTALVRITNAAMSAGTALVKSLTIDQVTSGWAKFEEKTTAVQTIMSATRTQFEDEAEQLAVINSKLQELNWFTDETSYNFTDMVSNIGKFTSAGVNLDTAAKSMQGIATWAAMSGANAVTASRAMYNLAQAIGVGYVKLIDWKTIENCNMATMEFKQTVLETAVELGTLRKEADGVYKTVAKGTKVTAETFSESLSEGWFSNSVLTKSLDTYNKATEKLHEMAERYGTTATEILGAFDDYKEGVKSIDEIVASFEEFDGTAEELIADLDILNSQEYELSISAFKAAQQAKTFTDVIDATKDAVSTGWMNTFEYIFGNYHEAVELFSDLCEVFYNLFAAGSEARNAMLALWKSVGGRDSLLRGIYKAFSNIALVLDSIKEAWDDFFGKETWERAAGLLKISNYLEALFNWLEPTERELKNIHDIFGGFFSVLDVVATVLKTILKTIFPMINPARGLLDIVLEIGGALGRATMEMSGFLKEAIESSTLLKIIGKGLQTFLLIVVTGISKIVQFLDSIDILTNSSKVFSVVITGLTIVFKGLATAVIFAVSGIIAFVNVIKTVAITIADSFKKLVKSGVNAFKAAIIVAKEAFISFINALKQIPTFNKIFERFGKVLATIKERFGKLTGDDGKLTNFFVKFGNLIKVVSGVLGNFIVLLVEAVKKMNPVRIILLAFVTSVTLAIYRISKAFAGMPGLIEAVTQTFVALRKRIGKPRIIQVSLLQIASSIAILAGALYVMANKIDANRLWECVGAVAALSGILLVLAIVATKLSNTITIISRGKGDIKSIGAGIVTLSASVLILAYAMKVLNEVQLDGMWKRLGVLASIAVGLAAISVALSKLAPSMSKDCLILLAFALSIASMVRSLKKLADINKSPEELQKIVESLTVLMVGLAALAFAAKGVGVFSAVGLIALVLTFKMVLPMLEEMTKYDYSGIKSAISDNIGVIALLVGLTAAMMFVGAKWGKELRNYGLGLIMMGAAIAILVNVMKTAQDLDPDKFKIAASAVGICLVLFALLERLSVYTEKSKPIQFAASLVIMSVAVAMLVNISKDLGNVEVRNLIVGESAVIALLGMVAVLEVLSRFSRNLKGVEKILIGVSIIAIEMAMLSMIPWQDIIPAAIAMGIAMVAFGEAVNLVCHRKWNITGVNGIIAVAAACVALGVVMTLISTCNWKSILAASAAMAVTMTYFGGALETISKSTGFNDTERAIKKIAAAIAVSIAMSLLAVSMAQLAKNDWSSIALSTVAMMLCLKTFQESLTIMSGISSKNIEGYKGLIAIAGSLLAMGLVLKLVSDLDWRGIGIAFVAIIEVLGYMLVANLIVSGFKGKIDVEAYTSVLAISVLLLALGGFLKLIASVPWESLTSGALVVLSACTGIALILIGLKVFSQRAVREVKAITKNLNSATVGEMYAAVAVIAALAGALIAIGLTFKIVYDTISGTGKSIKKIGKIFLGISGALIALSYAAKIAGTVGEGTAYNPVAYANILAMAMALLAIGLTFKMLADIEWYKMIMPLVSITIVLSAFAGLIALIGEFSETVAVGINAMKTMIPFAVMLLAVGAALLLISFVDWDHITVGLTTMAAVFGMLILVIFALKHINPGENLTVALLTLSLSAMLLSVGISLKLMAGLEWDDIKTGVYAMLGVFIVLSLCTLALANLAKEAPALALVAAALMGPLLAAALAMKLLSTIPDDAMGPAFLTLLGIAFIISVMTVVLSKVAPVAMTSFPAIAGALVGLSLGLVAMAFLDWDNIWYAFTVMLKIAGVMAAIVAGFSILTVAAPAIIPVLLSVTSTLLYIGGILVMIAGGFSVAALIFNTSILILVGAFKLLETVDWYTLGDGIQAAVGPLALLAATMAIFTLASLGNVTLLAVAASMNLLDNVNWNDLSLGILKTNPALLGLLAAIKEASLSNTITLILTANALKGLASVELSELGIGLTKVANGIMLLSNATATYESSGTDITTIANELLNARTAMEQVATAYESTANRIVNSNNKILLSSTLLGMFLGQGLVSGLLGSASTFADASSSVMQSGIDASAATARIESPSKVMAEQGSYLVQGLALGAQSEAPTAYSTMNTISSNTIRSAGINNQTMYNIGRDAIKSQNKGMADEAKSGNATRVITAANENAIRISGQQLKVGNYQNGIAAEQAKIKGQIAVAPDTIKASNKLSQTVMNGQVEIYDAGGELSGETFSASTAEGAANTADQTSSIFNSLGKMAGGNWYDGLQSVLSSLLSGFIDVAAGIIGIWDEETANYLNDISEGLQGYEGDALEAAGITSILDDTMQNLQNTMSNFNKFSFDDIGMTEVRYGDTLEWQEAYDQALEDHNYSEIDHLNKEKNAMWKVSMYSETYMNAQNKAAMASFNFEETLNNLTNGLDNFGGGAGAAGEQVDEFTQKIQDLHSNIESQIDAWNEFDRTIDIASEDLIKNLQSQISGVNEWSNKILVLAQRGISKGILEELANMGPQGYKYVEAFIQMTGEELATVNDLWVEKGTLSTASTLAIQAAYALAGDEASQAYVEGLGVNLEQVQNAAQQLGDSLAIEVAPEALRAIDAYKEQFNSLYDSIESSINIFEKFNMETETTSDEILENMRSQIEGVTKWSENLRILGERGISDGLLKELSALGPDGYDKVNAFVEMTQSQLEEANDLYAQSLELPSQATANVLSGYAQAGDESAKAFIEALGASISDVDQIGTYILEGLEIGLFDSEATQSLATTANNVGLGIIQQLMTATDSHSPSEKARQIGVWVDMGLRNGLREANDLPTQACTQMAEYMMQGLINGISSGSARVVDAMVNVCMEAKAAAERALDINSPSKVFAQIGKYTAMGFSEGIDQNAQMVANSTEEMGNASINTLKDALTHAKDLIDGNIDNTITLTPVLDLSNVRAGVQQINGMMNSASVSANATVDGSDESGKNQNGGMTFIQNNYSPKALNRIDIYRQTKNQFAAMKGLVSGT